MPNNETTNRDGPYTIQHGDVWWTDGNSTPGGRMMGLGTRHVCAGSEFLAIAFDEDPDSPDCMLRKHGSAARVRAWADDCRKRLASAGFAEDLTVVEFPVHPATVALLNETIAGAGRVSRFVRRLAELGGPDGEPPTSLPSA